MSSRVSFRDPAGRVFRHDGRILRLVNPASRDEAWQIVESAAVRQLVATGRIVDSRPLLREEWTTLEPVRTAVTDGEPLVLEHPAVPFPSYPYEWSPGMLLAAGHLTLDISEALLDSGWGLKDASAYNVLFEGARPVFVDVLSIERRAPGDATWLPYAQFQRNFLLPLLASRHYGVSLAQTFLARRDGLEPEAAYRLLKGLHRFRPSFLGAVSIPTWLGRRERPAEPAASGSRAASQDPDRAAFVLRSVFRHLRRQLDAAARGTAATSHWSSYAEANSYSADGASAKQDFVASALREAAPRRVLDVGCNTGRFSALAASLGADVLAIDTDPAVVDRVFAEALASRSRVLPLVVDLGRPSPSLGWRNREQTSFLERAEGRFDMVLALAVLHHLMVTDGIPLEEVLALLAGLTRDTAVVEFVAPSDPMFRKLARGRDALYAGLTIETFEACCSRHFDLIARSVPLGETRWLYLLRTRGGRD
jgi:SAM-dependent methyltransferase